MKILSLFLFLSLLMGCQTETPSPSPSPTISSTPTPVLPYTGERDPKLTPGILCTKDDSSFREFRYAERIAYCGRRVSLSSKKKVARLYKIPFTDFSKYEFDHFLPLAIGGANVVENIWPQPRSAKNSAHKNKLERLVFEGLKDGTLTQEQAVKLIMEWKPRE